MRETILKLCLVLLVTGIFCTSGLIVDADTNIETDASFTQRTLQERLDLYVYLAWMWLVILALVWILILKIREADRNAHMERQLTIDSTDHASQSRG